MYLNTLPSDALGQILAWMSGGSDIIRLWLTGDGKLHHMLKNRGALRSATFKCPWNGPLYCRLPGMLHSLSLLRELSITSFYRVAAPSRLWNTLSTLTGLRSLHLDIPEAETWLLMSIDPLESLPFLFDSLDDPIPSSTSSNLHSTKTTLCPIADTFPNLERLHLEGKRSVLTLAHIPLLPKSLKALKLPNNLNFNEKTLNELHFLPNLNTIWLNIAPETPLSDMILPPQITSLRFISSLDLFIPASFWSLSSHLVNLTGRFQPESLEALPSTIEKFNLYDHTSAGIATRLLPKNLTHLVQFAVSARNLATEVAELPASLKRIRLRLKNENSVDYNAAASRSSIIDPSALIHFPKQLRHVFIWYAQQSSVLLMESFKILPCLQTICLCSDGDPNFNVESLIGLPRSLVSLELEWKYSFVRAEGMVSVHNADAALPHLPPNLTKLALPASKFFITTWNFGLLPKSLKLLEVAIGLADDQSLLPSHFGQLPRSLQILKLLPRSASSNAKPVSSSSSSTTTTTSPSSLPSSSPSSPIVTIGPIGPISDDHLTTEVLSNLPRACLKELLLTASSAGTLWSRPLLASLSPHIQVLRLVQGTIVDQAILGLPSDLVSFTHNSVLTTLSGECFSNLPRRLVSLDIRGVDYLSDKHLHSLPPRLWSIHLMQPTGIQVTDDGIASLVPSVGEFSCYNKKLASKYRSATSRYKTQVWLDDI